MTPTTDEKLPYTESLAKWCDVQADDPDNKEAVLTLLSIAETLRYARKALTALAAERDVLKFENARLQEIRQTLEAERDALRAEVARMKQLVTGGKGELPAGAVAWLDMGKGEAALAFNKRTDSNRVSKGRAMDLFQKVPPGYYPLYLSPQDAADATDAAMKGVRS